MNSRAAAIAGVRVPRLPKPDPMRLAWYAQIPVAAVLFAGALSPVRLPLVVVGIGIATCAIGAASVVVAWRRRQISDYAKRAAATVFVQAVLNAIVLISMPFRDGGPSAEARILWGMCAVLLVVNSAVTLNAWRR